MNRVPLTVELWPGAVPGDAGIDGEETSRYHEWLPWVTRTKLITNVTKPSLTVYQPQQDNTGTAMVICPGGGYHDLFWELEGEAVAAWLNTQGMTGIILKYRCPRRRGDLKGVPPLGPLLDAQRALSMVRARSGEWGIDPDRIGIVGFSAGGHLSLATALNFPKRRYESVDETDAASCRPDFAVGVYPGFLKYEDRDEITAEMREIPENTPPVFLTHSSDDSVSQVAHSVQMYQHLQRAGVSVELHVWSSGEHDFGVRDNHRLPSSWTKLCVAWLRDNNLLSPMTDH